MDRTSTPKVSVIIPVYKVEKYLRQCLDSVINQTLSDIEIIIVDEGDMDKCREIIDEYESKDSRIITIHEKNGGYGASVNKGFDRATGEYIGIVESDDFIEPNMYEVLYNKAKELDADIVKSSFTEYWEERLGFKDYKRPYYHADVLNDLPENKLFSITEFPHFMAVHPGLWASIYKTDFIKNKNIRFEEIKGGAYVDQCFRIEIYLNTDKISWINKSFYNYRMDSEGSTVNNYNYKAMIQRYKSLHELMDKKYKGLWEIISPYHIVEEYRTTVCVITSKVVKNNVNQEDFVSLKNNLNCTSNEIIKKAKLLSPKGKKEIFEIKKKKDFKECNIFRTKKYMLFGKIPLFGIKYNIFEKKYYLFDLIKIFEYTKRA